GRPILFAVIKIAGIFINIFLVWLLVIYSPAHVQEGANDWFSLWYNPSINPIIYVLFANVIQSAFTLLLLLKWLVPKQWKFDFGIWKEMMIYALPMLVAGMGGMVNETFDRLML